MHTPAFRRALLLAALTGAVACEQDTPPNPPADRGAPVAAAAGPSGPLQLAAGAFAFANASGTRLLAMDSIPNPMAMHATMCPGAPARAVVADGYQVGKSGDTGRQTAANFATQSGARFRTLGNADAAPLAVDVSCYVTADSALVAGLLLLELPPPAAGNATAICDAAWSARVEALRGRTVVECWPKGVGSGAEHPVIFAVRFVARDSNALASLVAIDGEQLWFHDFPAIDHGGGQSVWRLDDGGRFPAAAMRIRFLSRVRGVLVLAMTWDGTEGENAYLLAADSSSAFRTLQHSYRYTAPQ